MGGQLRRGLGTYAKYLAVAEDPWEWRGTGYRDRAEAWLSAFDSGDGERKSPVCDTSSPGRAASGHKPLTSKPHPIRDRWITRHRCPDCDVPASSNPSRLKFCADHQRWPGKTGAHRERWSQALLWRGGQESLHAGSSFDERWRGDVPTDSATSSIHPGYSSESKRIIRWIVGSRDLSLRYPRGRRLRTTPLDFVATGRSAQACRSDCSRHGNLVSRWT